MINKLLECGFQKYQQGKLEKALENYQEVLQEDPTETEALPWIRNYSIRRAARTKRLSMWIKLFNQKQKIPLFNNSVQARDILSRQQGLIEATVVYDKAIRLQPNDATAYKNTGNCFFRQKNGTVLKGEYLKAIALWPNFTNGHYNYARLF